MSASGEVWRNEALVRTFLEGIRAGIPLAREQIDVMLRIVEARGTEVESFADLGCGSGVLSMALLERHPNALATLVDFSAPMMEAARGSLAPRSANSQFVLADLSEPGWVRGVAAQAPFDLVVSGYAIHHLTDQRKQELYREIFGLLRPGGLFVNTEHVKSATPWIETISNDLIIDSLHAEHRNMTREEVAGEFVHRPDKAANILASVEAQCEWLRQCGFEDVDCYFKIFEMAMFGGRRPAGER